MTQLKVNLKENGYTVTIGNGLLDLADKYMNLDRRVFILTDSGVPKDYALRLKALCREAIIYTVPEGEGSKSLDTLGKVLSEMLSFGLTRTDCAVAVGGGVVGDLLGFAAASYMRGIDFYNIPTTTLSQLDSSIGGKVAVNLGEVKNVVGAFYQPKAVLIDPELLKTLPKRHIAAGLAEGVKMALTSDKALFETFESEDVSEENIEKIIAGSLDINRRVVEEDERECGLRKILNFGHTLGHGIEANESLCGLYHGECVALGMLPLCSDSVRERLARVLKKLGLPTEYRADIDSALKFVVHDKKLDGKTLSVITVEEVGKFNIEKMSIDEFTTLVKERI